MQAIDFARLRQQERSKARRQQQQQRDKDKPIRVRSCRIDNIDDKDGNQDKPLLCFPPWPSTAPCIIPEGGITTVTLDPWRHVLSGNNSNSCNNNCNSSQTPKSLYYIPNFVSPDLADALVTWLQGLPEISTQVGRVPQCDKHNSLPMTTTMTTTTTTAYRQAVGKWTRLRHAGRRVALFDTTQQQQQHHLHEEDDDEETCLPPPLHDLVQVLQTRVWERVPEHNRNNRDNSSSETNSTTTTRINHILINEYTDTQGIMGHTDGPAYEPCTLTLSLASPAILHFTPMKKRRRGRIINTDATTTADDATDDDADDATTERQVWLQANSLVIFTQDLYQHYQHAIRENATTEVLTQTAWNGSVGQAVQRAPLRYSLTFRCKRPVPKDGV